MSGGILIPGAVLGCLLIVLAVVLALPPRPGRGAGRLGSLATSPDPHPPPAGPGRRIVPGLVLAAVAMPVIAGAGLGARAAVFSTTAVVVAATVGWLLVRHRARRWSRRRRADVAQACSVLAAQVRIGQVPVEALRSAARDCAVLERAVSTADLGGEVTGCWRRQAAEPGAAGLADLARGWAVSVATGAELAVVLDQVAQTLRSDQALDLVIASEAAAPRATGKVMAALPLVGICLGYVMGGDPVAFLLGSPLGWTCLLVGAVCACAGVVWMERVADHGSAGAG